MRVLLHICCGPCALATVAALKEQGHEVTGLFFNPNIHPVAEYVRRRDALKAAEAELGIRIIYKDERYDPQAWFREVSFRENNRCFYCARIRLEAAHSVAGRGNFEAFTTSLLYSRHQKHDQIATLCRDLAGGGSPSFLYQDFRTRWQEGIERSKALGLYRQDYCGCLYSDLERRKSLLSG